MTTPRQSTRWVFTWNNYDPVAEDICKEFADKCTYLVYGKETGDSGTPHLQGFFTLKKKASLTALKKVFGPTVHFEVAKSTSLTCANYCKKGTQSHESWDQFGTESPEFGHDSDVTEFGTPPNPGKRTDLQKLADAVKEGQTMQAVADIDPATYIRNYRGLANYAALQTQNYTPEGLRGKWYYGPPGTGKSRKAREDNPDAFLKSQNKWWDGYAGESTVILDDLDTNALGHYLKIWADRYPCSGEIKGGTVKLQHDEIIVTSNYSIEALWPDDLEMQQAIKRRFKVTHFQEPFNFMNQTP